MIFFSDFCLKPCKEQFLFLSNGQYDIAGLGYGAFEAFDYAYMRFEANKRVQKLSLIAPFLDVKSYESFALNAYQNDRDLALYLKEKEQMQTKNWNDKKLNALLSYGVEMEIFIGEFGYQGREMLEWFKPFGVVYYFRGRGLLHNIAISSHSSCH